MKQAYKSCQQKIKTGNQRLAAKKAFGDSDSEDDGIKKMKPSKKQELCLVEIPYADQLAMVELSHPNAIGPDAFGRFVVKVPNHHVRQVGDDISFHVHRYNGGRQGQAQCIMFTVHCAVQERREIAITEEHQQHLQRQVQNRLALAYMMEPLATGFDFRDGFVTVSFAGDV